MLNCEKLEWHFVWLCQVFDFSYGQQIKRSTAIKHWSNMRSIQMEQHRAFQEIMNERFNVSTSACAFHFTSPQSAALCITAERKITTRNILAQPSSKLFPCSSWCSESWCCYHFIWKYAFSSKWPTFSNSVFFVVSARVVVVFWHVSR